MALGTVQGGSNIVPLIEPLDYATLAPVAAQLMHILLMFDVLHEMAELARNRNAHAKGVIQS